ncbi:DUF2007 domain-containing protein [Kriegella sp. EG-1]|nr:DUF2007 domain-containing protein [Flavobacteriaceae bacterium EG-1]
MTVRNLHEKVTKSTFATVALFQYSAEAQIFKGRLETEGIEVFLTDNNTIDTDPLVSNAIGGVKLKVYSEDEAAAKEILAAISPYSLNDTGGAIHCPKCNSEKVNYFTNIKDLKSFGSFLVGFLFGILPFYTKYEYRCEDCKTKFNQK